MSKPSATVVQTVGLCKTFKDFWRRPRVEAVKELNLEIHPGEVFGLLGPNGSGKTTTIKMLLGLLYPTRGRISIFSRPPTDVAVKARIGFLPEESYLYRFLVAHETLDFYGRLFRLPARIRRERSARLLDMVGLHYEAKRPIGEYSKGMARRIGLAQALINDPEFLILDEPTSGLDPIGARQIKDVVRELKKKGKTILLSSHILADVEDVCDRVTILYGGQQRAAGDINELLQRTDATQITMPAIQRQTIEGIREVVQRLERKDIIQVSHPRVRLEDFFLRIVEEAQAANIRTSGARAGGEIPDFLQRPTEAARDLVGSLVAAAERSPATSSASAPSQLQAASAAPTTMVIDELLGRRPAVDGKAAPPQPSPAIPPASTDERPRTAPAADRNVIDALLGCADQPGGTAPADEGRP